MGKYHNNKFELIAGDTPGNEPSELTLSFLRQFARSLKVEKYRGRQVKTHDEN